MSDEVPDGPNRSRGYMTVWLVRIFLLAAIIAGLFAFRLATGRHYGRLSVELDDQLVANTSHSVYARGIDGVLRVLQPRPEDRRIWSLDARWPAVDSLVIAGRQLTPEQVSGLRVRLGASMIHGRVMEVGSVTRMSPESPTAAELHRRFGFLETWEVVPKPAFAPFLSRETGCVNWLGTANLVWLAVVQGFVAWLGLHFLKRSLVRIAALHLTPAATGEEGMFWRTLTEAIRLIMIISAAHLCWCFLYVVLTMTAPEELIVATVAATAAALMLAGWCYFVHITPSDLRLKVAMTAITVTVCVLKLWWLSAVEFRPFSDYREYHRYGALLAAGDWESIQTGRDGLAVVFLRRALTFAWPISRFVGTSISAYEVVNVLVQAATFLMLMVLISRMSGLRTAAFSLPFLLVYPELFYLTGVVTHNIPGYFWMVATWLAVDEFLRRAALQQISGSGWLNRTLVTLISGVVAGILLSLLELSKSYGSLFLIGLAVCMLLGPYLPGSLVSRGQWQRIPGGQRLSFFLTLLITEQYCVGSADQFLQDKSGLRPLPFGYVNYAAGVDPRTNASGDSVPVWLHYAYSVDLKRMPWVAARKILHEKLGTGFEFIRGLFRKNEVLARAADSMSLVQDNRRLPNADARPENVPYGLLQYALSHWIAFLVGVMFLLRLLLPGPLVRSAGELFPLVSVLTVMLAVYLVTEAHPYYSQNLIFLFCWSAGTSVERLLSCQGLRSARLLDSIRPFWPLPRCFAAMSLAATIAVFCLVGFAVDHSGLTFHRIARSGELQIDLDGMAAPVSQQRGPVGSGISRVHCWVEFSSAGGGPVKGLVASGNFEVQSEAGPLKGLRFFVSGNQRDRQRRIKDAWKDLPIRYSIAVNGRRFLENRPIEELATPRYVQLPAKFWLDDQPATESKAIVTITLECTDDVKIGGVSPPPAIALEYFH
jgi:hypothetical protein